MPLMEAEQGVSFIGRLGCYRYLDMHLVVDASLRYADTWLATRADSSIILPKCASPVL
jgi:UDP-galactopyranose mutase